ncbi:acyltransferase 3 [Xylogone sp. PMI_703]|nr:acyltransferase 3 [Xylogone sp. PMI_703]
MGAHAAPSTRNVKWVEGLRGLTSFLVIITHIARAFDYPLFFPRDNNDDYTQPRFWQLPIFRIPFQGRVGVPIFAFLTGFVCAYKPLRLAYQSHNQSGSLRSIAKSAFRRAPRLILPAAIATTISCILTYLGAYRVSSLCDAFYVRYDSPIKRETLFLELKRWLEMLGHTWTSTENVYDRHQWAMRPLLIGAFQVYIVLAATMGMKFKYRITVHGMLMAYWWGNKKDFTETFGSLITLGTLLAELSLHQPTQNFLANHSRIFTWVIAPIVLLTGLYLGSYPHEHYEWSPWSDSMHQYFVVNPDPITHEPRGSLLVPHETSPLRRMSSIAVQLSAISIFLSPSFREVLSSRWLIWLGSHSFAVYLVHGTILRTVGMWIAYGTSIEAFVPGHHEKDGTWIDHTYLQRKSGSHVIAAVVVFVMLTYIAAWAWMKYVDTACAQATQWLEKKVFSDEDEGTSRQRDAEKGYGGTHLNGDARRTNGSVSPP